MALFVTAFYVCGFAAAIHAVWNARTAQGAIAWAVSLVSFPFAALPAYLVFGRSKFEGVVAAYEAKADEIAALTAQARAKLEPWTIDGTDRPSAYNALRSLANRGLTSGNDAELLVDGEATFESILEGVAQARDYVLFQFYMIHDDGLGRRVQKALIDKARDGVRVFVLYDEVGSSGLPGRYVTALREAGVAVSSFRPTQGFRNRFQLNFRNHRKVLIADGRIAFTGGLNVGDEYMGRSPSFGPWRDTHVCVRGPAVQAIQFTFLEDWYWATHDVPNLEWTPLPPARSDKNILVIPSGPADDLETCGLFFVHAIHSARHRVWISSPYFVPNSKVVAALQIAALRGVDVRILLPEKADHILVWLSSFSYYNETEPYGVRLYRYQPGFLHQKAMLVDDDVAAVGSANLDNRSFSLNFEITLLIVDAEFGAQVKKMFEEDFANSRMVAKGELDARPMWFKFGVGVARLLAPIQ